MINWAKTVFSQKELNGVASIGNRPVVENDDHYLLEVYIFDFDQDVYGKHVQVEFVSHIRPEMSFDSFDALKQRIDEDVCINDL